MRVGINLLNYGERMTPEGTRRLVTRLEQAGYHLAMVSDHVASTPDVQSTYPAPFYEHFTLLAWLAAGTTRIRFGTTVTILPLRHPLLTARIASNLDRMLDGRLILGVGAGWARQEFDALGVPFERRGAITDEYLEAIVAWWAHASVSFEGRFASFSSVATTPTASPAVRPRLWIGGSSDAALRRAALHGDAWHPYRPALDWLASEGIPKLAEHADEVKRTRPDVCPRIFVRIAGRPSSGRAAIGMDLATATVGRDVRRLDELGVDHVVLDPYDPLDPRTTDPEHVWPLYEALAERVFDLPSESLR